MSTQFSSVQFIHFVRGVKCLNVTTQHSLEYKVRFLLLFLRQILKRIKNKSKSWQGHLQHEMYSANNRPS